MISSPRAIGADERAGYAPGVEIAGAGKMNFQNPPGGLRRLQEGFRRDEDKDKGKDEDQDTDKDKHKEQDRIRATQEKG